MSISKPANVFSVKCTNKNVFRLIVKFFNYSFFPLFSLPFFSVTHWSWFVSQFLPLIFLIRLEKNKLKKILELFYYATKMTQNTTRITKNELYFSLQVIQLEYFIFSAIGRSYIFSNSNWAFNIDHREAEKAVTHEFQMFNWSRYFLYHWFLVPSELSNSKFTHKSSDF